MDSEKMLDAVASERGENWRVWFAWHPVWLDLEHRFVWLRYVWRRDFELGWGVSIHQRRLFPGNSGE